MDEIAVGHVCLVGVLDNGFTGRVLGVLARLWSGKSLDDFGCMLTSLIVQG
jgi:hypothetical protein